MQIQPAGDKILAANPRRSRIRPHLPPCTVSPRGFSLRCADPPVIAVDLHQLPRSRQPPQLLAQLTPLLATAEPQLAHQLLESRAPIRQPLDVAQQFPVVHALDGTRRSHSNPLSPSSYFVAITWIL